MSGDTGLNVDLAARWRDAAERAGRGDKDPLALLLMDFGAPLTAAEGARHLLARLIADTELTTEAAKRRQTEDYRHRRRLGVARPDALAAVAADWGVGAATLANSIARTRRRKRRRGRA